MKKTLLIEIGTEELPTKNLSKISETLYKSFRDQLKIFNIKYKNIFQYVTQCRLAIKITEIIIPKHQEKIKKSKNYKKEKKDIDSIEKSKKIFTNHKKIILNIISISIKKFQNLQSKLLMKWSSNKIAFIRPVRNITILFGKDLIRKKILGIKSNRIIYTHKFIKNNKILINSADQYPEILYNKSKIIADYNDRKKIIKQKIYKILKQLNGKSKLSDDFLDTMASIYDCPTILKGKINKKFLKIPNEIINFVFKESKKYLLIYNKNGKITHNFIFVSNSIYNNTNNIISGNEKVINCYLTEIYILYTLDSKKKLITNLNFLKKILFQKSLGTLYDKSLRIKKISKWIALKIYTNSKYASRAGLLSKCDLVSNIVFNFKNIKGIAGMSYAIHNGENKKIAIAIKEQYLPKFPKDELPSNKISSSVSLADKIDNLIAIFKTNKQSKNKKDLFFSRRIANNIIQIIIYNKFDINLKSLINKTIYSYSKEISNTIITEKIVSFIITRFFSMLQKNGYKSKIIQSVISKNVNNLLDIKKRVEAINNFYNIKLSKKIMQINKRISNILKQSNKKIKNKFSFKLLNKNEEIALAVNINIIENKIINLIKKRKYKNILILYSFIYKYIENFFEKILIFDEHKIKQKNRLILLTKIKKILSTVANINFLN